MFYGKIKNGVYELRCGSTIASSKSLKIAFWNLLKNVEKINYNGIIGTVRK